jgi:hypothetical protein
MKFNVVKPFTLNHADGTSEKFGVGEHDQPEHIAMHWYVMAHTDKAPKDALAVGTPQHAAAMQALVRQRKSLLEEAVAALKEAEEAVQDRRNVIEGSKSQDDEPLDINDVPNDHQVGGPPDDDVHPPSFVEGPDILPPGFDPAVRKQEMLDQSQADDEGADEAPSAEPQVSGRRRLPTALKE